MGCAWQGKRGVSPWLGGTTRVRRVRELVMIVDFHTHIVPPEVVERRAEYRRRDRWFGKLYASPKAKLATAEDLVVEMERARVDKAVVFGFAWADAGLLRANNDYVLNAARRYPERLVPFAIVNPRDAEEAACEAERCAARGARGLGELMPDGQGYELDDLELMKPVVEVAVDRHLVLLTHVSEPVGHAYPGKGNTTPDKVIRLAQAFPDLTLVCAHLGGGLPFYELMPELMVTLGNVYYDTAASHLLYRDRFAALLLDLMPDKVLWATDYPLVSQQHSLARWEWSHLPAHLRHHMFGDNARRLLNLG